MLYLRKSLSIGQAWHLHISIIGLDVDHQEEAELDGTIRKDVLVLGSFGAFEAVCDLNYPMLIFISTFAVGL